MIANGAKALDLIAIAAFDYGNLPFELPDHTLALPLIVTGLKNLTKLNLITVGSLLVISCLLGSIVFVSGKEGVFSVAGTMSFGAAMELSIIMPLSWLPLVSDYTRYAKRTKTGPLVAAVFAVPAAFMYAIGLWALFMPAPATFPRFCWRRGFPPSPFGWCCSQP